MCVDVQLCNRCVREFLILARTWFAFSLPSKTGCDTGAAGTHRRQPSPEVMSNQAPSPSRGESIPDFN
jgi:hypothetical protein